MLQIGIQMVLGAVLFVIALGFGAMVILGKRILNWFQPGKVRS